MIAPTPLSRNFRIKHTRWAERDGVRHAEKKPAAGPGPEPDAEQGVHRPVERQQDEPVRVEPGRSLSEISNINKITESSFP